MASIDSGKALDPVSVDFHKEENGESHQTEDYDLDNLVLRRGQEFKLTIGFDRDFDQDADNIILQFVVGRYNIFMLEHIDAFCIFQR